MKNRKFCLFIIIIVSFVFPVFPAETVHILQKGETIYSVARSYGVSPGEVLSLNKMSEEDAKNAQAGKRLLIPAKPQAPAKPPADYRVVSGDTLYSIARRHNISVAELEKLNNFPQGAVLKVGQKIKVPAGAVASQPAKPAEPAKPAAEQKQQVAKQNEKPAAKPANNQQVRWPVKAKELSYLQGKLSGVMVTGEHAEPVKSLTQGTVVSAGPYRGFGRVAIVQVAGGYLYVYGGCESLSVKIGDKVAPGAELGRLGIDSKTEKPQLFFLVYKSNNPIDPAKAPRA